jgi:hypothetical protein
VVSLVAVLLLAGCGGVKEAARVIGTTAALPTTTVEKCKGAKSAAVRARKIRRLELDIRRLRRLAAPLRTKTSNGTPALARAVDDFLLDVASRDLSAHTRSRFIDHAAAIVSRVCEQCFQALEASRPVGGGAKLGCG